MKGLIALLLLTSSLVTGAVESGALAPNFTLKSGTGKNIKLSDYNGKIVVLEWLNHGMPFC